MENMKNCNKNVFNCFFLGDKKIYHLDLMKFNFFFYEAYVGWGD